MQFAFDEFFHQQEAHQEEGQRLKGKGEREKKFNGNCDPTMVKRAKSGSLKP
jgi:hypothetical protein